MRLNKFLASSGVASRRAAEKLIADGKVTINGEVVLLPQVRVNVAKDRVAVDGKSVRPAEKKVYYIVNKPVGYLCSAKRRAQEKLVLDLFDQASERLFTVGRLDRDTQGLLLVTNDGEFANAVIHPSAGIEKEYLVKTDQEITHEHLVTLAQGTLVEGDHVRPIQVEKVRRGTVKIVIGDGKKREVRLLMESAGLRVKELTRIRLGGLLLGRLPVGQWRVLGEREKQLIFGEAK